MEVGPTELIFILVIVILLFGVGRISKIGGELGSGIRSFREGLQGTQETPKPYDHADDAGPQKISAAEPDPKAQ